MILEELFLTGEQMFKAWTHYFYIPGKHKNS